MHTYKQFTLDLPFGKINAQRNNTQSNTRILCLHGWLDNYASFKPLFSHLEAYECVAVDLIGHGQSTHRAPESLNHYVDYVRDIKLILKALNWDSCHLVGHSMGGAIGLICASVYPQHIASLTMIDALHPISLNTDDAPKQLKKSLEQFENWDANRQRIFPSLEDAVQSRLSASPFSQTYDNAKLLMQYATEKTNEGYRLRSDARLNFRSPIMLSLTQIEAFIQAVKQPTLAILASDGIIHRYRTLERTLALYQDINIQHVSGGHHIHMEKPHEISHIIQSFIDDKK